jgi:hypothetical protein
VFSAAGPLREQRWTVVQMPDPGYTFGAEDEALEFVSRSPVGDDWCVVDLKGHILYRVTAAEAVTMERAGLGRSRRRGSSGSATS